MELLLQRKAADGEALPGDFFVNGKLYAFSLERTSKAIAPGRYRVLFTVSDRARRKELWSPDAKCRLPLIDGVPGRSGLRFHAGNFFEELEGCIALGRRRAGAQLMQSRAVIEPFVDLVAKAAEALEEIWITIEPVGAQTPLKA